MLVLHSTRMQRRERRVAQAAPVHWAAQATQATPIASRALVHVERRELPALPIWVPVVPLLLVVLKAPWAVAACPVAREEVWLSRGMLWQPTDAPRHRTQCQHPAVLDSSQTPGWRGSPAFLKLPGVRGLPVAPGAGSQRR